MKKFLILVAMICFVVLSGGPVLADNPADDPLSRHAVWTNWFDDDGNRLLETPVLNSSIAGDERKVSYQPMGEIKMKGEVRDFDFIHETEYYDYQEDHKNSA